MELIFIVLTLLFAGMVSRKKPQYEVKEKIEPKALNWKHYSVTEETLEYKNN